MSGYEKYLSALEENIDNITGRYGEKANSIKEFLECLTNGTFNSSFPEKCKINESK